MGAVRRGGRHLGRHRAGPGRSGWPTTCRAARSASTARPRPGWASTSDPTWDGWPGLLDTLAAAYGRGATVTAADLEPFLGEAGALAPWDLTDAIDAGRTAPALEVLHRMLSAGESHPLVILALLHKHYRQMLRLDGSGVTSPEQAAEVLGTKSAFPAKKALAQANRLGTARIARAVQLLAAADLDLRGTTGLPGELVVEVLVARLSRLARQRR